jgi:hypothetical protein
MESIKVWSGTASELLKELQAQVGESKIKEDWAKSARALSGALKRLAPNLRACGLEVTTGIRTTGGRRLIRLEKICNASSPSSRSHSAPDLQQETSDDTSDANSTGDDRASVTDSSNNGLGDDSDASDDDLRGFSNDGETDEEAELAAQLEYYGAGREEADATARRMFQDVPL